MSSTNTNQSRSVSKIFSSKSQAEGNGARVRRSIGRPELSTFDPFLLLDEFLVAPPAGFPDHPHRGFETVTYLLPDSKGTIRHEDFCGHKGVIKAGDLQWMTAGRGILHSEMPGEDQPAHGLQLWVNLPSQLKMTEPRYQELPASALPRVTKDGVTAIVIAGETLGTASPVYTHTPTHYAHIMMEPNSKLDQEVPENFNTFIYSWKGSALVGRTAKRIEAHQVVTMNSDGDRVRIETKEEPFEFVLVSGKPLKEPIARRGPFVMNTQAEILQTMEDYSQCKNGFENAKNWSSE